MKPIRLGLRENLAQLSLLVLVNAFVGAIVDHHGPSHVAGSGPEYR